MPPASTDGRQAERPASTAIRTTCISMISVRCFPFVDHLVCDSGHDSLRDTARDLGLNPPRGWPENGPVEPGFLRRMADALDTIWPPPASCLSDQRPEHPLSARESRHGAGHPPASNSRGENRRACRNPHARDTAPCWLLRFWTNRSSSWIRQATNPGRRPDWNALPIGFSVPPITGS